MPLTTETRAIQARKIEETRREPASFPPTIGPPRGVLRAAQDRGSHFFHQRLAPNPALAPYIQHFWYVQWDLRGAPPSTAETLPHPSCYLVFEHDLERPIDDPAVHRLAQVSGVCTSKFSRSLEGWGRVFGCKFQPGGLRPFLLTSVSELTDKVVPATEIFGPQILPLASSLRTLASGELMVEAASKYLAARLPAHDPKAALATSLVDAFLEDATILRVEDASTRNMLSVRSLQRLFKEYVGVSPKWVIRRFRLHEMLERLHSGEPIDGARLALELGYADQSHLINDFRKLVGFAPTTYLARTDSGSSDKSLQTPIS